MVKTRFSAEPFNGEGARLYGGRWNSPGTRVAYASDTSALAVLEILVHLVDAPAAAYSLVAATIPDALVEVLSESSLPDKWNTSPVPADVQAVGDNWVGSGSGLALRVPSAVVPGGFSLLINPNHPDFKKIVVESVAPFEFDSRLRPD